MHWSAQPLLLTLVLLHAAVSIETAEVDNYTITDTGMITDDVLHDVKLTENNTEEVAPTYGNTSRKEFGDFVKMVTCHASGMDIELQSTLPQSNSGTWNLEVENYPDCPNGNMKNVGAGYKFTILYRDRYLCGVDTVSPFEPHWVSYADTTLLLKDGNHTLADSVSCLYNTRVDTSLITFNGQMTNEQLRYSGTVDEEGTDVEGQMDASRSINMEFVDEYNQSLGSRNVLLGDPIKLILAVADGRKVQQILPEHCYFSSSSIADEKPSIGNTLTFIRKGCFNEKNPMVRAILPKMDRSGDGRRYELPFQAFHFAKFGHNLYVHCTVIACVGNDKQCEPEPTCFGNNRKKRSLLTEQSVPEDHQQLNRELQLSRVVVVGNVRDKSSAEVMAITGTNTVCMHYGLMVALTLAGAFVLLLLLAIIAYLIRRQQYGGKDDKVLSGNYSRGAVYTADVSKL